MSNLFETGIRPAIDAYLLEESKKTRSYGDYWSASSAGYCMRKVIFERLGVPHVENDSDARKQRVFTSGHIFHSWIQELTKEAGLSIAQEVELIDDDIMVKGHFDDLVLVSEKPEYLMDMIDPKTATKPAPKQHLILYDYKTQNSRAFSYKRDKMSHFHRLQLGTYMYIIRKTEHPELTEARILKISKDDLRMSEEQLLWTADLEKDVVGYWSTINGYWKAKTIPKCTCADYEGGFMSREQYNPYFYNGEPCSMEWYKKFKEEQDA